MRSFRAGCHIWSTWNRKFIRLKYSMRTFYPFVVLNLFFVTVFFTSRHSLAHFHSWQWTLWYGDTSKSINKICNTGTSKDHGHHHHNHQYHRDRHTLIPSVLSYIYTYVKNGSISEYIWFRINFGIEHTCSLRQRRRQWLYKLAFGQKLFWCNFALIRICAFEFGKTKRPSLRPEPFKSLQSFFFRHTFLFRCECERD